MDKHKRFFFEFLLKIPDLGTGVIFFFFDKLHMQSYGTWYQSPGSHHCEYFFGTLHAMDDAFSGLYRPQTDSYLQYRALDKPGMTFFDDSRTVEVHFYLFGMPKLRNLRYLAERGDPVCKLIPDSFCFM